MSMVLVQSVWTLLAFIFFIAVVIWAWSGARKKDFDEASRLPLDSDEMIITTHKQEKADV